MQQRRLPERLHHTDMFQRSCKTFHQSNTVLVFSSSVCLGRGCISVATNALLPRLRQRGRAWSCEAAIRWTPLWSEQCEDIEGQKTAWSRGSWSSASLHRLQCILSTSCLSLINRSQCRSDFNMGADGVVLTMSIYIWTSAVSQDKMARIRFPVAELFIHNKTIH